MSSALRASRRLADVDEFGSSDPPRFEDCHRDGRVLAFEPAACTLCEKGWLGAEGAQDDIDTRALGDFLELRRAQVTHRQKSRQPAPFKAGHSEAIRLFSRLHRAPIPE